MSRFHAAELCQAGYAYLELRRFAEAARSFERAMEIAPDAEAPALGLAHVRFAGGRLLDAGAVLHRALRRTPGSAALHATLAEVHLAHGKVEEAREALRAARDCPDGLAAHVLVEALEEAIACGALPA